MRLVFHGWSRTSVWIGPLLLVAACSKRPAAVEPPRAEVRPGREGAPASLKIASWNLEWLHGREGAGVVPRQRQDYERLRRYAERLDADVVAVQEVESEAALRRVFDDQRHDYHVASQKGVQLTGFAYRAGLHVTRNVDHAELDVGGVRVGADVTLHWNGVRLRLLSVHLKSGCFDQPLSTPSNACRKLCAQLPALERWIDERAAAGEPFVVLGDFNRRLGPTDGFYAELDDGDPPGADLTLTSEGRRSSCWRGRYPRFIDHIVLSREAARWWLHESFEQLEYDHRDAAFEHVLSGHCPISIRLGLDLHHAARTRTPPPRSPASRALEALPIKGNVARGRRLYHLPSCPSYETTRIDPERGERLFASEQEALAAGWNKAGNCPP